MPYYSRKKQDYINGYQKESYQRITVRVRKESDLPIRIQIAATDAGQSVNQWILEAIQDRLEKVEKREVIAP